MSMLILLFFCYSVNVPFGIIALLCVKATLELNFGLQLLNESNNFSSDFGFVFSLNFKNVICHMRINEGICVGVPQWNFYFSI